MLLVLHLKSKYLWSYDELESTKSKLTRKACQAREQGDHKRSRNCYHRAEIVDREMLRREKQTTFESGCVQTRNVKKRQ